MNPKIQLLAKANSQLLKKTIVEKMKGNSAKLKVLTYSVCSVC